MDICDSLGLTHVPMIYFGPYDEAFLRKLHETAAMEGQEGYVIRTVSGFAYEDFNKHVAKYVRKNHVQTDQHWLNQVMVPNKLKERNEKDLENLG